MDFVLVHAFRLYGNFHWPPVGPLTLSLNHDANGVDGVVDIYFAKQNHDPQMRAFLRWRTRAQSKNKNNLDDKALLPDQDGDNAFLLPQGDLTQRFGDARKPAADVRLWIFDPSQKYKIRLTFSGAAFFQQFPDVSSTADQGEIEHPKVIWPLVRECRYERGRNWFYSRLVIGQDDNHNFRFDLQLPTPFPQTSLDNPALNPAAFPFSAIFKPMAARTDIANVIALVVGRWVDGPNYQQTGFSGRLGSFGFSAGQTKAENFAEFQSNHGPSLSNFWPTNASLFAESVFGPLGLKTQPTSLANLIVPSGGETELSFQFLKPKDEQSPVTGMIYRIAVVAIGDGSIGKDDDGQPIFAWGRAPPSPVTGAVEYRFLIKLKEELGGILRIASDKISVDLVFSWSIKDFWRMDKNSFQLSVRMNWQETIFGRSLKAIGDGDQDHKEYFRRGALLNAAATVDDVHAGLPNVEGALPFSALPVLSVKNNADVRFILTSPPIPISLDPSRVIARATAGRQALRLTLAPPKGNPDLEKLHLFKNEWSAPIEADASFPAMLRDGQSQALPISIMADTNWIAADARSDENTARFFASFLINWHGGAPDHSYKWRLSSLSFDASKNITKTAPEGGDEDPDSQYLRCGGPGVLVPSPGAPVFAASLDPTRPNAFPDPTRPTAIEFQMRFGVDSITPTNVDIAPGDRARRNSPLLIRTDRSADQQQGFVFTVTEHVAPTLDRELTAEIEHSGNSVSGKSDYVLLSEEPFSVLRFREVSLAARSDEGSATVAEYSSDDRLWKLRQVADRYHYVLPPQVAGESADKPRRLEIFDLPGSESGEDGAPYPPYDEGEAGASDDARRAWGNLHRRAVEFRLTPSTELWLRPSDVQRNFYMAEWDADQLFRQRGELGLGAALGELRGEFLYGLSVGVDVSRERGVARQARVAEIEALTGHIVGPPSNEPNHRLAKEWNALAAAIARRPQRLEIWANDPDSQVPFAPARFADGVSFALRETALVRAPVVGPLTASGNEFEDLDQGDLVKKPRGDRVRYHPQGLSGGALWPIESANLFWTLRDNPDSVGGSIESIALSPIGGDASQKANFLNGIFSITSETRNGFIERQRVEVIGRIGTFWHRAKHVVVYARTTSPTAQFAPTLAEDPHQRRSRRPILRKVSEYVELIQWERHYPDFSTATKRHAGFLESVRFNSRRINVDSAWSSDVGDYGWQIPLWNRAGARQRPQVYPMPDIAFVTTSEGDGDDPVVAQECRDPDKLYFFADFKAGTDDTDTWVTRLVIDYLNLPAAATLADIADTKSAQDPDHRSRRPSVGRSLPGASRFTWRLAPAARRTALNAGRASKPVYVGLDSVAFMRSAGQKETLVDGLQDILTNSAGVDPAAKDNNGALVYGAIKDLKYWDREGNEGPQGADVFKNAVADLCNAKDARLVSEAATKLFENWNDTKGKITTKLQAAAGAAKQLSDKFSQATDFVGKGEEQCQKLKADAISTLRGKSALVTENIRTWANDANILLPWAVITLPSPLQAGQTLSMTVDNKPPVSATFAAGSNNNQTVLDFCGAYAKTFATGAAAPIASGDADNLKIVLMARFSEPAPTITKDPEISAGNAQQPTRSLQIAKKDLIDALKGEVVNVLRPIFAETSADVGRGEADVETARAIVADVDAEVEAVFERARARLTAFSASYDHTKPWSKNRRGTFQAGVYAAIDNIKSDIAGLVDEARRRFAVELGNAGQAIGGQLSKLLQTIAAEKVQAIDELADLDALLKHLIPPMASIDDALLEPGGLQKEFPSYIKKTQEDVQQAKGLSPDLKSNTLKALDKAYEAFNTACEAAATLRGQIAAIRATIARDNAIVAADINAAAGELKKLLTTINESVSKIVDAAKALADCKLNVLSKWFDDRVEQFNGWVTEGANWLDGKVRKAGEALDETVDIALAAALDRLDSAEQEVRGNVLKVTQQIDVFAGDLQGALEGVRNALGPGRLAETVLGEKVIRPALGNILAPLPDPLTDLSAAGSVQGMRQRLVEGLNRLDDEVKSVFDGLTDDALTAVDDVSGLCSLITEDAKAVLGYFKDLKQDAKDFVDSYVNKKIAPIQKYLHGCVDQYVKKEDLDSLKKVIAGARAFDYAVRSIQNDLGRSVETARMYGDRVLDAFAKVDLGKPLAVPGKLLKLYSAVTSAPEIAALKSDIDRIRSSFDEARDIIKTTRANALFNHLGDELKALGLSLPFDSVGERIIPADLSNLDIGKVFSHFGGADLGGLLDGCRVPSGVADAVRVTHDFDKALARAWVQVDIDAPMPGRRALFSLEVFKADLVNMRLTGTVRLEASQDSDTVSETGFGRLVADLDMVAGGQSLVTFQQVALNFSKERGLKVEFDPTRVRLNPGFQFIQDYLTTLFPDQLGGLKVIKKDGLPVGLEHEFAIPPISLMFGTSGISNISISNSFRLLAYPDFIIADRFALSRPELPFIFSIFVIGGSGYIQLDAEYQPFDQMLAVTAEAAVGGSATIGFAFGPFSGEIFIALSATITYRKVIGRAGGGLSIGALLVIAGNVNVCGIVTIGIYLVLRITYSDSGQADANGSLSVTITISRFFKITARANVHYKLRGGRSESTSSTSVSASTTDSRVNRLMKARG